MNCKQNSAGIPNKYKQTCDENNPLIARLAVCVEIKTNVLSRQKIIRRVAFESSDFFSFFSKCLDNTNALE